MFIPKQIYLPEDMDKALKELAKKEDRTVPDLVREILSKELNIIYIKARKVIVNCSLCGEEIEVTIFPNKRYIGGHYFGKVTDEKFEYWECSRCFKK